MLYSTESSLLKVSFFKSFDEIKSELLDREHVVGELTRYNDKLKSVYDSFANLIGENRVLVKKKTETREPTYLFLEDSESDFVLIVNVMPQLVYLREYTCAGLLLYNFFRKTVKSKTKNTAFITHCAKTLSKILYTVTRRPMQESTFLDEATIWCIYHYLRLKDYNVQWSKFRRHVSYFLKHSFLVEKQMSKVVESLDSIDNYTGKTFLDIVSSELLDSTFDLTFSQLLSKYGPDVCCGIDEPVYIISSFFVSEFFKTGTFHNIVPPQQKSIFMILISQR